MKHLYTLFLITAISFNLQAQRNFKPGYIVTLKGDTTKGSVDYKDWLQNPRNISFKAADNDPVKQYGAGSIKAFGVTGLDYYVMYTGPVSTGAVQLPDLSSGINAAKITDTIFLRIVLSGSKVALYSYTDIIKTRFFIAETNAGPVELERYVYRDNSSNSNIMERNIYQEQLKILADKYQPGNTTLSNRAQRATYQTVELEKIITAINGLSEVPKIAGAKREGIQFFVGAGANLNQTAFSGNNSSIIKDIFYSGLKTQSVGPSINFGLDYYFNKNSGKLIFRMELSAGLNKITGSNDQPFTENLRVFTARETFNANQLNLSLTPQLIYTVVNNNNLKFYLGAGVRFNKPIYSNQYYYIDFYEGNALNKRNTTSISFSSLYFNPTAKAGIILPNAIEIYAGYDLPEEIVNERSKQASFSSLKLGVNYRFGKK